MSYDKPESSDLLTLTVTAEVTPAKPETDKQETI